MLRCHTLGEGRPGILTTRQEPRRERTSDSVPGPLCGGARRPALADTTTAGSPVRLRGPPALWPPIGNSVGVSRRARLSQVVAAQLETLVGRDLTGPGPVPAILRCGARNERCPSLWKEGTGEAQRPEPPTPEVAL